MATIQSFLYCDNSTLANFKNWAQAISNAFTTFGWSQATDTGQVNWSTISTVPGSGALVYEVWQPNDGLTTFKLKMEYGNFTSQTNFPDIRISLSNSSDGAGNLNGFIIGPFRLGCVTGLSSLGAVNTYECDFSGAAGRFCCLMWRNGGMPILFAIERSVNSSGGYTGSYVTLYSAGGNMQFSGRTSARQQSLVFGVGCAQASISYVENSGTNAGSGWITRAFQPATAGAYGTNPQTYSFAGGIGVDFATPFVGYFDFPCTVIGVGEANDLAEGVTFTTTVYGTSHTYMPAGQGYLQNCTNINTYRPFMRYD